MPRSKYLPQQIKKRVPTTIVNSMVDQHHLLRAHGHTLVTAPYAKW